MQKPNSSKKRIAAWRKLLMSLLPIAAGCSNHGLGRCVPQDSPADSLQQIVKFAEDHSLKYIVEKKGSLEAVSPLFYPPSETTSRLEDGSAGVLVLCPTVKGLFGRTYRWETKFYFNSEGRLILRTDNQRW